MLCLDHIGIADDSAVDLLKVLDDLLGRVPYKIESVSADHVRTYFINGGSARVELLEALDRESPIAGFVEKRGRGLHHIAFEVDDVDAMMDHSRSLGYRPLESAPRKGADDKRIFFLHPSQTAGVLIEFCQSDSTVLRSAPPISGAAVRRAGSGNNPVIAYVHSGAPVLDQDILARRLERQFLVYSIRAEVEVDVRALVDGISNSPVHFAAEGDIIPFVLAAARRDGLIFSSLALVSPTRSIVSGIETGAIAMGRATFDYPTLVLARDDDLQLEPALRLHRFLTDSRLVVVPDADLSAQIIGRHAAVP